MAEYLAQVDKEYKKSTQLLKDNCDKNNFPRSCANYGQNLLYGKGILKSETCLQFFISLFHRLCCKFKRIIEIFRKRMRTQ